MRLHTLYRRSIRHHWRAQLAVALGVIVGTAALTGALLVGDAMRGSLRQMALGRLGRIDHALVAQRFFRETLAEEIATDPGDQTEFARVCPAIVVRGGGTHTESRASVERVSVIGIDQRFWELSATAGDAPRTPPTGRVVVLNAALADELRAVPGDDILLRIGKPSAISTETLLGRRDDTTLTLRLTVDSIVPAEGLGAFSLNSRQTLPRNAYVPLATLQRALGRTERVNTLLVEARRDEQGRTDADVDLLAAALRKQLALEDLGLRLRVSPEHNYVALESETLLIEPALEATARAAAAANGTRTVAVLTHLANTIAVTARPEAVIPYSTVAAIAPADDVLGSLVATEGAAAAPLAPGEIVLNEWAAGDLAAKVGDEVEVSYYVLGPRGQLRTEETTFRLRGVARLADAAADPGFTPEYPGVTDTDSVADWDPPFPIDLRRIRAKDEAYWDQHRTTPKAFVSLADGQRLWAAQPDRLGRLTSLRLQPGVGDSLEATRAAFERAFLERLDPAQVGLRFDAIRARALVASRGATDFGALFLGFSFFLIISAAMLVALLFRLGVERRSREVGLLLALGFSPWRVAELLLAEGLLLAGVGAAGGLAVARGYAWLMLAGLRTWWADAVNTPYLRLYDSPMSYIIGYGAGVIVACVSIAWSLRGLTRLPSGALLAGVVQSGRITARGRRTVIAAALALLGVGLAGVLSMLTVLTDAVSQSVAFFCGGMALLIACVAGLVCWLGGEPRTVVRTGGLVGLLRLGVRNARRRVGRSVLTAGLIAVATFVIAALQAARLTAPASTITKDSGTGGAALFAESAVPLPYDLDTADGRAALGVSPAAEEVLAGARFIPFRLRDGDETSCLNLYRPTQPRLLGASSAAIARGGFAFSATLAESESERKNPWTLLRREFPDGAIPVIADEAAALWQLHVPLGGDLVVPDERGRDARLRIVALLKGSFLQGELIMAEGHFTDWFPSVDGQAFFLIDTPLATERQVEQALERELTDFGMAVGSTRRRLAELQAVQNTYLSTFQTLGGLGLLLGTFGLVAVLLRNVWERRSELALLGALGFSRARIGWLVLSENGILLAVGLLSGLLSAGLVIAPHVASRAGVMPWQSLLLMFVGIFLAGMLAGLAALVPALRTRLLPALRSE